MKDLKPYIVEFEKNKIMKPQVYSDDCIVKYSNYQQVILITYNDNTFSANNNIQ